MNDAVDDGDAGRVEPMRIAVFGAGAVGGHLAVRLALAGHSVGVIVRSGTAALIERQGLQLRTGSVLLQARVQASADAADLGPQQLVLVTVKATALAEAAAALAPLVDGDTTVVFVQNGLPWWYAHGMPAAVPRLPQLQAMDPQGRLARLLDARQALGAVVLSSNAVVAPGVVENFSPSRNVLHVGEIDDADSQRVQQLRRLLVAAGMQSPAVAQLRKTVWRKLVLNMAGSPLCTLVRRDARVIKVDAGLGLVFERLAGEALAIAAAHGIVFAPGEVDVPALRDGGSAHRPSMLQDFERGAPLEIDAMLRAPQQYARAAGVPTPVLDTVIALLDRLVADR